MLAGQRVLITKFDHDPSRAVGSARHKRCSWPIGARQEQWLRAYPQATAAQAATLAETVLNMTTAKALGLDVPTSILLSADELIE